eukprot:TRINITY_DN5877_c0_g1_i2.p1 TRINITY_DN5877_c0_g1~~TRINITY_DN5877_c0_g1_i2.p1  ORF type:complete len:359 (-),score=77.13 TRINITY_DN5877_c0_g1_i2:462-1406(-)
MATGGALSCLSSTHGSGGILDIFYPPWKLKVCENAQLFGAMRDLWRCTYGARHPHFSHPYTEDMDADRGYMYIDRVGYRVPDAVSAHHSAGGSGGAVGGGGGGARRRQRPLQRSLTPHLDCCPHNMAEAASSRAETRKWRPIQSFVALTDTLDKDMGGFECVPGFHLEFDEWAKTRPPEPRADGTSVPPPCVGDFTPLRPRGDAEVLKRVVPIPVRAGGAVFWDVRLPHANAQRNCAAAARAVVYTGFLPCTPMNRRYVQKQLHDYRRRVIPQDQWVGPAKMEDAPDYEFSALGRCLVGIDEWPPQSREDASTQ